MPAVLLAWARRGSRRALHLFPCGALPRAPQRHLACPLCCGPVRRGLPYWPPAPLPLPTHPGVTLVSFWWGHLTL